MIQKEVAIRMSAKPNSKNYSRISIMVQTFCNVSYETDISKNIFNPKPRVDSSIVKLKKKNIELDFDKYSIYIKHAFKHRRKKIKNNLKNYLTNEGIKVLGERRPEDISVEEYLYIFNKFFF